MEKKIWEATELTKPKAPEQAMAGAQTSEASRDYMVGYIGAYIEVKFVWGVYEGYLWLGQMCVYSMHVCRHRRGCALGCG